MAEDWFAPIRAGDREALGALFREHYASLCRFTEAYVGTADAAEDIVQELFAHLWRRRTELHPTGSPATYLFAAARNRALNRLRGAGREARRVERLALEPRGAGPGSDEGIRVRELADALRRAIHELPERPRACLLLSRAGGLTYAQIADVLGIAPKTVEAHMGRALRRLRADLEAFLPSRDTD